MANINKIRLSGQTYNIEDVNATKTVELTQAQYNALTVKDPNTFYVITDAQGVDLSNYYTKSETSGATEISTALASKADTAITYTKTEVDNAITAATSTKQDTLVSGANIKTINNESILGSGNIEIEGGGGKVIEAGRGIDVTTGTTADTVSFNLPISAGTGQNSVVFGKDYGSDMFLSAYTPYVSSENSFAFGSASVINSINSFATGYLVKVKGGGGTNGNFAQGYMTTASGNRCHSEGLGTSSTADASHSEGYNTTASGNYSHSEGEEVKATNVAEHSQGRYNVSNKANGTWGDSGNTLFSVGNGTAENARHNAFEIRQNGDIYLTKDGQDVKLQDQLGGGGSSYTAGDGINITNDVISVSGVSHNSLADGTEMLLRGDFTSSNQNYTNIGFNYYYGTSSNKNSIKLKPLTINGKSALRTQETSISVVETSAITTSVTSSSTDAQVPSAKAVNDKLGGLSLVKLTQAQYDALATKDSNVLYVIVG